MKETNQSKNINANIDKNLFNNSAAKKSVQNVTYVFSHSTLLDALKEWEKEQIEHYPHQKERIQTTVVAMQHFLRSRQVREHKMIMSGDPHNFEIAMPNSPEQVNSPEQANSPEQINSPEQANSPEQINSPESEDNE